MMVYGIGGHSITKVNQNIKKLQKITYFANSLAFMQNKCYNTDNTNNVAPNCTLF